MKSSGFAYLLALAGLATPFAGLHRFYLGRPFWGFLYLITWGFAGIGTVIDLFNIPRMVEDENRRLLYPGDPMRHAARLAQGQQAAHRSLPRGDVAQSPQQQAASPSSSHGTENTRPQPRDSAADNARMTPEQRILRIAREKEGIVTVAMIALHSGLTLRKAKKELERLRKEGFCSVDVSTEGVKLYVFDGLLKNERLELTD